MPRRSGRSKEVLAKIPEGDRRVSIARQRVMVRCGDDGQGKVRFYFEDEGPQPFHQQMSAAKWITYEEAP